MANNKIIIVQGMQYGSEAKGQIAGVVCEREQVEIAVRTGATNAGHTIYYRGKPVKFQQLPVAAVIPGVTLVLGAGSLIDLVILKNEIMMVNQLTGEDIRHRLLIDYRAGLHLHHHQERSSLTNRHHLIGATGKGCSEALVDRIKQRGNPDYLLFGQVGQSNYYNTTDTCRFLNERFDAGAKILLEGTQGQLLDLYLGPYPYTTHKQTGPGQWMLECGLSPALPTDIIGVVRTFPIRVAGNSGPLPNEISWPDLARTINGKRAAAGLDAVVREEAIQAFESAVMVESVNWPLPSVVPGGKGSGLYQHTMTPQERQIHREALSELNARAIAALLPEYQEELRKLFEFTTVTKKLRRIGDIDLNELKYSAQQCRPHRLAVTFMNYVYPENWYSIPATLSLDMIGYISGISTACGCPIDYLGWGPDGSHVDMTPFSRIKVSSL